MTKINPRIGFSLIVYLLLCAGALIIAGTIWYIWRSQQSTTALYTHHPSLATSPQPMVRSGDPFELAGLHFRYDSRLWSLTLQGNGTSPSCGDSDSAVLRHTASDLHITIIAGDCTQPIGSCRTANKVGCIGESKSLANVALSPTKIANVLAQRVSIDSGKYWSYSLYLADGPKCDSFQLCFLSTPELTHPLALIMGSNEVRGYTTLTGITSLDDFAALSSIKAATQVLETARY